MLSKTYVAIDEHTNSRKVNTYQAVLKERRFFGHDRTIKVLGHVQPRMEDACADAIRAVFQSKGGMNLPRKARRAMARNVGKVAFTK